MGRRSTPDRIYQARRAAILSRLVQERRLSEQRAESLVAGWETEAATLGLDPNSADFWRDAPAWITEQLDQTR